MKDEDKTKKQLIEKIGALEKSLLEPDPQDGGLLANQAKLRAFANASPDVTLIMDEKGTYIDILTSQHQLLVSDPEKMLGKNVRELLSKEEANLFLKHIKKTLKTNSPQVLEYELEVRGGKRWFEARSSKIDGIKQPLVVFVTRDITERKMAEEALQESEERYRSTLDGMIEGCQILDYDLRYLYVNRAAAIHGQVPQEEKIGRTLLEVYPDLKHSELHKTLTRCLQERTPFNMENEIKLPSGQTKWFSLHIEPIPEGVFLLSVDVTERKKAELALISSQHHFKTIMETSPDYIWMLDNKLNILYGNRVGGGYNIHELIGTSVLSLFPKEKRLEQKQHLETALKSKSPYMYEIEIPTDYGPNSVFENLTIPTISDGKVTGLTINSRDISERKRADRLLRALNQASLAMSPEHSPEEAFNSVALELQELGFSCMLFPLDDSGSSLIMKYISYDSKMLKSAEKLLGLKASNFIIKLENMELFRDVIERKQAAIIEEPGTFVRKVLPKNLQKLAPQIIKMLKLPKSIPAPLIIDGKVIGLFSVLSDDLTAEDIPTIVAFADRMAAAFQKARLFVELEESHADLSEANEKFSKTFYSSPSAMLISSFPDYRVLEMNQRFKDLFGLSDEDLESEELLDWSMWVNADEKKHAMDQVAKIGSLHNFESLSQTSSGELLNIISSYVVLETKSGKILLTTTSDVTETRKAEQSLRESETRYRTLSSSTFEGIGITEKGKVIDGNQQMASMLGYELKEMIGAPVSMLIHPDDQEFVGNKIKEGSEEPYEHRAIRKDGRTIDLEVRGKMMERNGQMSRVTVIRDITQQKKSKLDLERKLLELTSIQAISSIGIETLDENEIISSVKKVLSNTLFPDQFGIWELDKQNNILRPHSSYSAQKLKDMIPEIKVGLGILGKVVATSEPIRIDNTAVNPDYISPKNSTYLSELCVPIGKNETLFGVINVEKKEINAFSEEDERLVITVANQLSIAIDRARLFKRERQQRIEAEAHREASRILTESTDINEIFNGILSNLEKVVPFTSAAIHQITGEKVEILSGKGFAHPERVIGFSYSINNELVQEIVSKQQPLIIANTQKDAKFEHFGKVTHILGWMGVPLIVEGQVIGVLTIDSEKENAYSEDDAMRALTFANNAAAVIQKARLFVEIQENVETLKKTLDGTVNALASTAEKRDPYTTGHQESVKDFAIAIANEIGLEDEIIEGLKVACVLHDIGKIYVPAEILNKPGKLTAPEMELIKTHPSVGNDILKSVDFPWPVADIVLQHHERMDGSGYPAGLSGEDILIEARLLAVADIVEAISSHRPYRPALGLDVAIEELTQNKGILYDSDVVDVALKLLKNKSSF